MFNKSLTRNEWTVFVQIYLLSREAVDLPGIEPGSKQFPNKYLYSHFFGHTYKFKAMPASTTGVTDFHHFVFPTILGFRNDVNKERFVLLASPS